MRPLITSFIFLVGMSFAYAQTTCSVLFNLQAGKATGYNGIPIPPKARIVTVAPGALATALPGAAFYTTSENATFLYVTASYKNNNALISHNFSGNYLILKGQKIYFTLTYLPCSGHGPPIPLPFNKKVKITGKTNIYKPYCSNNSTRSILFFNGTAQSVKELRKLMAMHKDLPQVIPVSIKFKIGLH